ncbi:hypothetical protein PybrP1_000297, partial [[Pythium] brassicae (nom. inval.)]
YAVLAGEAQAKRNTEKNLLQATITSASFLSLSTVSTHIDEQWVGADKQQVLDHVFPTLLQRQMQWCRAIDLYTHPPRVHVDTGREEKHLKDLAVARGDGEVHTGQSRDSLRYTETDDATPLAMFTCCAPLDAIKSFCTTVASRAYTASQRATRLPNSGDHCTIISGRRLVGNQRLLECRSGLEPGATPPAPLSSAGGVEAMNASPSDASLASSKKPSTANSNSSKRMRTIIVARSISDAAPTASTRTALSGAVGASTASGAAGGGTRAGSGESRLPTYAALGSSEDVSLYEKYLADQRSRPSAAELRHGAGGGSPQHLKASMKRKTISQLIGVDAVTNQVATDSSIGSKSTNALPQATEAARLSSSRDDANAGAGADAATRALMAIEIESDARKRREALVAHRAWLKTLPIHERLAHQRQQNALRRWRQVNRDWEQFKARTSKRLGKPEQDLVMSRAAAYREHVEMYDALQKARPLAEKVGGDIWLVSLRGDGTRFVPVGNIFSGLFCPIRESTRIGPRVRRPLDPSLVRDNNDDDSDNDNDMDHSVGNRRRHFPRPVSQLEKRSIELLAKQKRRLRKQLQQLLPHEVGASASSHLAVGTVDLFEWAATGRGDGSTGRSDDAGNQSLALSLQHSRSSADGVRACSQRDSKASGRAQQGGAVGPSLKLAVDTTDVDHLQCDVLATQVMEPEFAYVGGEEPVWLNMYGDTNEQLQRSIALENDGSTALHYQWTREAFATPEFTPHLQPAQSRQEMAGDSGCVTMTSLSATVGTLLPGEKQIFTFSFESQQAGVFLEKWLLDVDPPARINASASSGDGDDSNASGRIQCGPLQVRLSCTAVDNFVPRRQLLARRREMERKATVFMVEQLVEDVLRNVHSEPVVEFPELQEAARSFCDLNRGAFSDVYYSEDLMRKCRELYAESVRVLASRRGVGEQATALDAWEDVATAHGGEAALPTLAPTDSLASPDTVSVASLEAAPEEGSTEEALRTLGSDRREAEWDSRLTSLRAITRQADEWNARQIKQLTVQLAKLSEAEEQEEQEEQEEDDAEGDEDEDEEADESDEDSGAEDDERGTDAATDEFTEPKPAGTAQGKPSTETRAACRERIQQERCEQRRQLDERVAALRPRLQDAFRTMYLEACTASYVPTQLRARLAQGILSLCSEVPVIHAIARMQQAHGGDASSAQQDTEASVARVLTRAIDEAVALDASYQSAYECERREFHKVLLSRKQTLEQLLRQCVMRGVGSETGGTQSSSSWLANCVVFIQVDLDLAHWFTLVKERSDASAEEGVAPTDVTTTPSNDDQGALKLKWWIAPELLERDDVMPEKVVQVAHSLRAIKRVVSDCGVRVAAIVLASDLSSPPLTKATRRLLKRALQQTLVTDAIGAGEPEDTTKALEQRQGRLLKALDSQLSLRPAATLVKRALDADADSNSTVAFCASLTQLDETLRELRRKDEQETEAKSTLVADASTGDGDLPNAAAAPAIIVLENIKTLARAASGDSSSNDADDKPAGPQANAPSPAAVTSPPPAEPKPGAATSVSRKKSVSPSAPQSKATAASANPKATATTTLTPPSPALPSSPATTAAPEAAAPIATASDRKSAVTEERTHAEVLGSKLAEMCDVFVLDTLLPSPWERIFTRLATASKMATSADVGRADPPVVLGPRMRAKAAQWEALALRRIPLPSPPSPDSSPVAVTTAIVGGTNLVGKLRLIDSLLEVADAIYFVGDVALSLYRVLFTKHDDMRRRWRKQPERSPQSLWSVLVPAVERLKQKAQRKCVQLLLPVDWIVGESPLEEQDTSNGGAMDGDDDEEEDEAEEEEEEESDKANDRDDAGERDSKKKSKKPKKRAKAATRPKKPVVEPDETIPWRAARQWAYEGATARASYRSSPSVTLQADSTSWISVFDDGDSGPLASIATATPVESPGNVHTPTTDYDDAPANDELDNPTDFEFEWTFRAFDVGPESMALLLRRLDLLDRSAQSSTSSSSTHHPHHLIVHGLFGVVEFQGFDRATRDFVAFLERRQQVAVLQSVQNKVAESHRVVLLSGEAMLQWTQRFEAAGKPPGCKFVTNEDRKMAFMLRDVLAAKPNSECVVSSDYFCGLVIVHSSPSCLGFKGSDRRSQITAGACRGECGAATVVGDTGSDGVGDTDGDSELLTDGDRVRVRVRLGDRSDHDRDGGNCASRRRLLSITSSATGATVAPDCPSNVGTIRATVAASAEADVAESSGDECASLASVSWLLLLLLTLVPFESCSAIYVRSAPSLRISDTRSR